MAKKQKQPSYRVELEGLGIVAEGCKLIVTGATEQHFHLEQRGKQWLLLVNDMFLFDTYGDELSVEIEREDDLRCFKFQDGKVLQINSFVKLNVAERHVYYYIDVIAGAARIAVSRQFIGDKHHSQIKSIKITKE